MKLYIKQRVFTLGERFYVRDENNQDVFYVEGSFFRIPKKFLIYNMDGDVVATMEKQLLRLLERYDIQTSNKSVTLKKQFTFLFKRFSLENTDWQIEGNITGHQYQLVRGNRPVMSIRKHWFTWGDSYELTIDNPEDVILSLAIVIAIDAIVDNENSGAQVNWGN